jgi:hypothetical protein
MAVVDRANYEAAVGGKLYYYLPKISNSDEYGVQGFWNGMAFTEENTLVIQHDDNEIVFSIDTNSLAFQPIKIYNLFNHVHFYSIANMFSVNMQGDSRIILTLTKDLMGEVTLYIYYKASTGGFFGGCARFIEEATTCKLSKRS